MKRCDEESVTIGELIKDQPLRVIAIVVLPLWRDTAIDCGKIISSLL
jgi:hypothetical protein